MTIAKVLEEAIKDLRQRDAMGARTRVRVIALEHILKTVNPQTPNEVEQALTEFAENLRKLSQELRPRLLLAAQSEVQ